MLLSKASKILSTRAYGLPGVKKPLGIANTLRLFSNGRLNGKTVFITGASAGIGEACAKLFAAEGSNLILTARRHERLSELKKKVQEEHPQSRVHIAQLDVRDKENVDSVISSLPKEFQAIDVLVNNAGLVIGLDTVQDVTVDAIDTMFDTNVKGLLYCTKAILPKMKEQNKGHIINMSSIAGKEAYANGGVYCATKHAVEALTRSLRFELMNTRIRVTSVAPGMVETEFSVVRFGGNKERADQVYKGMKPLSGHDIAETIVFAASRPEHVELSDILIFPNGQAAATTVHRQ
ncbi:NAD(P)-binding protein [Basidiobolus meristosporus CBS 931.73]|uniref:NAD(P)-binding protein n=1 Tax=Basidiobolus meristosporus CBS 931.73 TaxID=1314790 RepID=A0A1Y1Y544_9FUNG|nr:NAD(P)-binding protein [Basidiobolus meristosporus CBS 931.73]|eukprot:ORX93140.1 NAD(P)-binding protein [Basidiobolus meristosporus CBS 931.73]